MKVESDAICIAFKRTQSLHSSTLCPTCLRMGCRRTDCIARPLSGLFEKLGSLVGSCPFYFLIIPVLLSVALSCGFIYLKDREDNDLERQFTPSKGPSKAERAFVRENFPYDDSMFSEERLHDKGNFASVIAATNKFSVLAYPAFEDIISLNNKILNITVDDGRLRFNDLCARTNGECVANIIQEISGSNETNQASITYPVYKHNSRTVCLGSVLGGVVTDANSSVISAHAVKLFYYLKNQDSTSEACKLWLKRFKGLMSEEMDRKHINVCIIQISLCVFIF